MTPNVPNLPEDFLYERLPEAVVNLDERGLVQAVVGGIQDRLEDLRSYSRKLQYFFDPVVLPDTGNNVVLVDLISDKGVAYTRSLDPQDDTPAEGSSLLPQWAATQLGLELEQVYSVRYGRDLLRAVDTNVLGYLAETIGAVIYQTGLTDAASAQKTVSSYFPRLKIKGTSQSFDVLGRVLGFDDVIFIPLWGRVSPRMPSDIGNEANNPDFAARPEYQPQQQLGPFYNPLVTNDGPFYAWSGTAENGTASTSYYAQVINGFNPFIEIVLQGSLNGTNLPPIISGTVTYPATGSYALANGGPHVKAYVDPEGASIRFRALAEGASFNGVYVQVDTTGSISVFSVDTRLSAVKYRTSYFDLAMTTDIDRAEDIFGHSAVKPNKDIKAGAGVLYVNGTPTGDPVAVSPWLPWTHGSISTGSGLGDWLTFTGTENPYTYLSRIQAYGTELELNTDKLIAAGQQVAQAMEEVRPATRLPRRATSGLLIDEQMPYAAYLSYGTLFTTGTALSYTGSLGRTPSPDYVAGVTFYPPLSLAITWPTTVGREYNVLGTNDFITYYSLGTITADANPDVYYVVVTGSLGFFFIKDLATGTLTGQTDTLVPNLAFNAHAELDPNDSNTTYLALNETNRTNLVVSGSYDTSNGSYSFDFAATPPGVKTVVHWTTTSTEVIREEPLWIEKALGTDQDSGVRPYYSNKTQVQARPEDEESSVLDENVDEYPWLRAVVAGGELVETDSYVPENQSVAIDTVDTQMGVKDQSGADNNVYGIESPATGVLRLVSEARATDTTYQPGQMAVGFRGQFRDLSAYTATDNALVNTKTDLETIFLPGFTIYNLGLVQGVFVADPAKFFGPAHRDGLVGWFPFNEHVEDDLSVVDHSANATAQVLTGFASTDRIWDSDRGWYLSLPVNAAIRSDSYRGIEDDGAVSFWINVGSVAGTGTTCIFEHGAFSFDLDNAAGTVSGYLKKIDGSRQFVGSWLGTGFSFVYLRKSATAAYFGGGDLNTAALEFNALASYYTMTPDDSVLTIQSGSRSYGIHDLRIWNASKSQTDMDRVRAYAPVATIVNYRLGWIYTLNRSDRYGLRVLNNGFVTSAPLPPWLRTVQQARVRRYLSSGSYVGQSRYKEVGLQGHALPAQPYLLGSIMPVANSTGTVVGAGTNGVMPGENALWLSSTSAPTYLVLFGTDTVNGGTLSTTNISAGSYWPAAAASVNANREAIWVKGDNQYLYELTLTGDSGTTYLSSQLLIGSRSTAEVGLNPIYSALLSDGTYWALNGTWTDQGTQAYSGSILTGPATITTTDINSLVTHTQIVYLGTLTQAEQPTGAEVILAGSGTLLSVHPTGFVYQKKTGGTLMTPPLFMYLNQRVVENAPTGTGAGSAWRRWTDHTDSTAFGNDLSQHPEVPVTVAALSTDGLLQFLNNTLGGNPITAGNYRLEIESGNIGKTDADFDGFAVEITVNNTVLQKRLLQGRSGYNVRGADTFDFTVTDDEASAGAWLMSILWTNALDDPATGTKRQLAIYSYRLWRQSTEQFKVQISPSNLLPLIVNVTPNGSTYDSSVTGGWLHTFNGSGTLMGATHEVLVYPDNVVTQFDVVTEASSLRERLPLADILTALTNERREDIITLHTTGSTVLPDDAPLVLPAFGTLIVESPASNVPFWVMSGALTPNPSVVLSAHMRREGLVRAAVSTSPALSSPVYSEYVYAGTETNHVVKLPVSGLQPWTTYYYGVESAGSVSMVTVGTFTTFGSDAHSFSFVHGACSNNKHTVGQPYAYNGTIWDSMRAKNPLFFLQVGDWHYNDIESIDRNEYRDAIDAILLSSGSYTFFTAPAVQIGSDRQRTLLQTTPFVYVWDDHDFGDNDSDKTNIGRAAVRSVYREYIPHYQLPDGSGDNAIYYTFRVGRCVFIVTDQRSERSPKPQLDDANKTVLGAKQKAWFKQVMAQANADSGVAVIFWVTTFPWIGAASAGADFWAGYTTERAELATYFKSINLRRMFMLSGDMHSVAIGDGSSGDYAAGSTGHGYPIFHSAPIYQATSSKGGPYQYGPYPGPGYSIAQFGTTTVRDDGVNTPSVQFTCFDAGGQVIASAGTTYSLTIWGTSSPYP